MRCSGRPVTSTTGLRREAKVMRGRETKAAVLLRRRAMGQRPRIPRKRRVPSTDCRLRRRSSSRQGRGSGRPILTAVAAP